MKTTKKTINPKQEKKTTKVAKPKYVVDLTGVAGEYDTMLRFALCKYDNNANTKNDLWVLKEYIKDLCLTYAVGKMTNMPFITTFGCGTMFIFDPFLSIINDICVEANVKIRNTKKPNIFKRFWNWITRKK